MTRDAADDVDVEGVSRLSRLVPDPERAERLRAQCRTRLARRWGREAPAATIMGLPSRLLTPVVVGGFCVLYAVALVATTLRLHEIFR